MKEVTTLQGRKLANLQESLIITQQEAGYTTVYESRHTELVTIQCDQLGSYKQQMVSSMGNESNQ